MYDSWALLSLGLSEVPFSSHGFITSLIHIIFKTHFTLLSYSDVVYIAHVLSLYVMVRLGERSYYEKPLLFKFHSHRLERFVLFI